MGERSPSEMLYLTWIRRHLRILFINTPSLWCRIHVSLRSRDDIPFFLERTSSCLPDITVSVDPSTITHKFLLEALRRAGRFRWKCYGLAVVPSDGIFRNTIEAGHIQLSLLHTMEITFAKSLFFMSQTMFPSLVHLSIERAARNSDLPNLPHLRTFRVKHAHYRLRSLRKLFNCTSYLEKVDLEYVLQDDGTEDDMGFSLSASPVHLEDVCSSVSLVLGILSNPTACLDLRIRACRGAWGMPLDTQIRGRFAISRIAEFWSRTSGVAGPLPPGTVCFYANYSDDKLQLRLQGRGLSYETFEWVTITEPDSLLNHVKTLEIRYLGRQNTFEAMTERLVLDYLPRVERVAIVYLQSASGRNSDDILTIEHWMYARNNQGQPLQNIAFQECDLESRPLFDRLAEARVASSITWDDSA